MNDKPSLIKRIVTSLWQVINVSRKLLLNLIFFTLLFIFIGASLSDKNPVFIPNKAALVLNLSGDVVEQKHEIDPMDAFMAEALNGQDEKPEVLLTDIVGTIKHAATDDRITVLVLKLQRMNRAGLTKLTDIANAIEAFKKSGKQVIAVGDQFTQDQYYLSSYADEIWLDPKGWMLLDGYGRYQMYFKSALEKLSITPHIFRVGTYKSAVEPYMRDDMSPAAKEANQQWLADLWTQYKTDVAAQRGFSIDNFDENIDILVAKLKTSNGNIAEYALNNQWVDALKTRNEMQSALINLVGKNEEHKSFNQVSFNDYLATLAPANHLTNTNDKDKVAVIVAKGVILNGIQKAGSIGGDSTAKLLRQARNNAQVKAVVLRVDSPGGSAYASEIIRQEVKLLKKAGKTVVASMGTYAASGGYWISAPADKIYASPTTITGSIGIFGFLMTFENTLSKLGVYTDGVGTTDLAGFGLTRPMSDGMSEIFQLSINRGYHDFISLVADNRNMTLEQVDAIAQGRVWSGSKAKTLGLVDELGDLNDAIVAAANLAKLTNYDTLLIEKELSPREKLMQSLFGQAEHLIPTSMLSNTASLATGPFDQLMMKLKGEFKQLNQFNDPNNIYTFCLPCEIN
jgi:protease-4